jgi:hypothetical protein
MVEAVSAPEFVRLKRNLAHGSAGDVLSQWARWFLDDRGTRTISPFSSTTVPEYTQRRIQENTLESLHEAVSLSPTNGLAYARLARQVLAQSDKDNPRRVGEADFFSRRAVELSPDDPEVQQIRSEIERQVKNITHP